MLPEARLKQLNELAGALTNEELIWAQGYLAGVWAVKNAAPSTLVSTPSTPIHSAKKLSIVYGTETGNSKNLATKFAQKAKQAGIAAKLLALDQYRLTDLPKEENLVIVISTHGEGEPPASAKKFYDHLYDPSVKLSKTHFAVLALGDSAYPLFCQAGEDVDRQLAKLGGTRMHSIHKCDVDYETDALTWFDQVLPKIGSSVKTPASDITSEPVLQKTGRKFYQGKLLSSINLNGRGSQKETYHIEIGCDEAINYQPGDALGIVPQNRKDIVHQIIKVTGVDPSALVETTKAKGTVQEVLTRHVNICHLTTNNLKNIASITGQAIPDIRRDLIDILRMYPVSSPAQFIEIVKTLSPIAPRLYSISSSPTAHEGEIHITVARNQFQDQDEIKFGLCSTFIGNLEEGSSIDFYIHHNRLFKLPAPEKDMIMIGPGSGIAAMRSFLYERDSAGATGKNWLFFGDQHFTSDFLYQTEIQKWLETGVLNKLSTAFSRDQEEKVYVQHKMLKHEKELYQWLENGASLYVSGTKDPMSKDVDNTLIKILQKHGNKSQDEAVRYVETLKEENRYLLDVY
jgi:sulfite reductase (NADPH) flavoprotein alpha-component